MSAGVARFIARWGFWFLLAYGWAWGELRGRKLWLPVALWVAGFALLRFLPFADALFTAFVALVDVALVLMIFKGDVRIG